MTHPLDGYSTNEDVVRLIGLCRNSFGDPLGDVACTVLHNVIEWPSDEAWDEAHGVVVAPQLTLWEALLAFTSYDVWTSPHYVASTSRNGSIRITRTKWNSVPTSNQILQALRGLTPPTGLF